MDRGCRLPFRSLRSQVPQTPTPQRDRTAFLPQGFPLYYCSNLHSAIVKNYKKDEALLEQTESHNFSGIIELTIR